MGVIARQSIKGAMANYLGVAIGFVVSFFVLTRYLTQEEIGLTRVLVDAALLFSSVAQLGTGSSLVRFFPYFKSDGGSGVPHHGVFGLAMLVPLIGFSLFALAFLLFRDPLIAIYSEHSPLVADYFYLLPMLTFFALYTAVFEAGSSVLLRITVPKLVREVGIRLFNLAAYLLYGFGVVSLDGFVWLFCGSYAAAMVLNLCYLVSLGGFSLRLERHFLNREMVRDMVRYTLFMTITALAGNIPLISTLFLGAKVGLALTGVYTIASYVANVVEVPYRSLGAIAQPVIATAVKENRWDEVNRLARQVSLHQLLASSLIFYLIWINIDTLFAIIPNGADYAAGAGVVLILGVAKMVNSSLSIGSNILNFSRYYAWSPVFILVLSLAAIGLNDLFIGRLGIEGAATAILTAYVVYFTLLLGFLYWRQHVSLFSAAQVKVVVMLVLLMVADMAWKQWVTPLGMPLLVGAAVKTVVLGGAAAAVTYCWGISPTVNKMVKDVVAARHKRE